MSTQPIDPEICGPLNQEAMPQLQEDNNNEAVKPVARLDVPSAMEDKDYRDLIKNVMIAMHAILCKNDHNASNAHEGDDNRAILPEKYLIRRITRITETQEKKMLRFDKYSRKSIDDELEEELECLREDVGLQAQIDQDLAKIVEDSAVVINRNAMISNAKKDSWKIKKRRFQLKKETDVFKSVQQKLANIEEKVSSIAMTTNLLAGQVEQIKKRHPR